MGAWGAAEAPAAAGAPPAASAVAAAPAPDDSLCAPCCPTVRCPPAALCVCRLLISSIRKPISYVPAAKVSTGRGMHARGVHCVGLIASACCPGSSCATRAGPPPCLLQRLLQEHGEVHLSALGIACSSMVTVAEILKARK